MYAKIEGGFKVWFWSCLKKGPPPKKIKPGMNPGEKPESWEVIFRRATRQERGAETENRLPPDTSNT